MKYFKLKFLLLFFALAAAIPSAWAEEDVINKSVTSPLLDGTYSSDWKTITVTGPTTDAKYVIRSMGLTNANYGFRWNANGYLYTTTSGGRLKSVTIAGDGSSNKSVDVFASNTPYTEKATGTPVGTVKISDNGTKYDFEDDYTYIAINGKSSSTNLYSITIEWEPNLTEGYAAKLTSDNSHDFGRLTVNNERTWNIVLKNMGTEAFTPTLSGLAAPFSTTYTPAEIASGAKVSIPVIFNPTTAGTFEGTLHIGAVESEDIDLDVTLTGVAAYELTVCDETTENTYLPVYGLYVDEFAQNNQMIYPASLLQSLKDKKITSMTFYNSDGIKFATNVTFSLKNLDANTSEYESTPQPIQGYTAVRTEEVEKNTSLKEWTITFDEPFMYNGGDLLLNVATTMGSYGATHFYGVNQNKYQSYYTSNYGDTRSYFLPKVTFAYEDAAVTPDPVEAGLSYGDNTAFTVYPEADFTAPTLINPYNVTVTYGSTDEDIAVVDENTGEVVIGEKIGTATITASFAGNDEYLPGSASYTITIEAKPELAADSKVEFETTVGTPVQKTFTVMGENLKGDVTLTLNDENNVFALSSTTIAKAAAEDGAEVTVTYNPTAEDIHMATVTVSSQDAESVTVSLEAVATEPVLVEVATPTFSLVEGSYTGNQQLTIDCATEGATILYRFNEEEEWHQNRSLTLTLTEDCTVYAKATKADMAESPVATASYIIDQVAEPAHVDPIQGYFSIKNNGNEQYANIQGRKTLRFTDAPADEAGTVIYVETNENGQVQSLRSQACDLQGYANKAMNYVPELVHLVAQKLELEGVGELFGETGVDAILDKFNESFDYHLYVEPAEGGYRIYGKTPSMQPVVEFYRENQAKVEAKLPMMETAINNAIQKILEKTNGSGAAILTPFSLHQIWENMGRNLTEPVDEASTMDFYRQVLNNKNNVWSFAYETAMIYWTNLKNHPRYQNEIRPQLGEFADYLDKLEQVRPDFKYYIAQKDGKPDFISEGNVDIINNNGRAIWTLEPRTTFTVNIPEENKVNNEYVTTLYTDFAYTMPEGVTAYKVTGVTTDGIATTEAIEGIIPAQTPVLIKATEAGDKALVISTEAGAAVNGNLLKGPDYLIGQYQLKAESVAKLFNLVKGLFGEEIYNRYMLDYEHLMLRYAGTVNNKYFWGLSNDDLKLCGTTDEYGRVQCVVRSLDVEDGEVAFYDNMTVETNKAFLVSETHDKITLSLRGDINRDGKVSISDVTALIDILLADPASRVYAEPCDLYPRGLDYVAADFNENGEITISDVTELIDYLLANSLNN